MFHTNRNDVITSDDITDIVGVHVGEENGSKVATLKVLLDPRKDWDAVKEFFVHLTNGINHRMIGPVTASESPTALPAAPAPAVVEPTETPTATTEPLVETPATTAIPLDAAPTAVLVPEPESSAIIAARAASEPVTPTPFSETTQPLAEPFTETPAITEPTVIPPFATTSTDTFGTAEEATVKVPTSDVVAGSSKKGN